MGVTIKLDAASFVKWAKELSEYKLKLAIKSGLNKASRLARNAAIELSAIDEGISVARVKRSVSALSTASPSRLLASFTASKQRILILNVGGAKWSRGVGLTASTHRVSGGGSAHLSVAKAFVLRIGGNKIVMIRKSKKIKAIYAEHPGTALGQTGSAPAKVWKKTVETRLPLELNASIQAVLNGLAPSSDSGSNT